jgi:hypothetical protein
MARSEILALISKLRAMTTARGCTEAEALAAAEKVRALMEEHGLDDADIEGADVERLSVDLGRRRQQPIDNLWGMVAWFCRCRIYWCKGRVSYSVVYVGRSPWPEVAAYLHEVCLGAGRRAVADFLKSQEYRRRRTTKTRAAARKAFNEGFVESLTSKIYRLAGAPSADFERDRAIASRWLDANVRLSGEMPDISKASQSQRFAGARAQGRAAGRGVAINHGVAAGSTDSVPLIGRSG